MTTFSMRLIAAAACAVLALGGCAERGTTATPAQTRTAQTAQVTLSIQIPTTTSAKQRRPAFLSGFVKSVSVRITGPGGSATGPFVGNCSSGGFCSQTVDAPIGTDTFSVSLYDQLNATGNLLSSGTTTATILGGQSNTVTVTFNPVIGASTSASLPVVRPGTPSTTPVTLIARDPDGATIMSPGTFENASGAPSTVTVSLNDTTGHFSLQGTTSYTAPQTPGALSLVYDGALLKFKYPTLTVLQDGTPLQTVAVQVLPAAITSTPIVAAGDAATSLAEGADGNVWFTARKSTDPLADAQAGRYAIATAAVDHYPLPNADANPNLMTSGPDGALWFFEQNRTRFARLTTAGTLTEYAAPFQVSTLAKGPDGNVWFVTTESPQRIGKITPSGTITAYTVPSHGFDPLTLTAGPGGRMWVYASSAVPQGALASIATDGTGYTTTPLTGFQTGSVGKVMYYGRDGNFYLAVPTATNDIVFRVDASGNATAACQQSVRNGFITSTVLDDGTLMFAMFQPSFGSSTLFGVTPAGQCNVISWPPADPINTLRLISGGGDLFLYGYDFNGNLNKYGY
jgi:streptogramin lyase